MRRPLECLKAVGLAFRRGNSQSPRWPRWSFTLSHDPGSIPTRDLIRRPFQAGGHERREGHGWRVDGGETKLDLAAVFGPNRDRVGDAGRHWHVGLPVGRRGDRSRTQVLVFRRGRRPGRAPVTARCRQELQQIARREIEATWAGAEIKAAEG